MTQTRRQTTETTVRVTHSGRDGITLALIRQFVREADEIDLPGDARVRWEDKLAGEGANRTGFIEATDHVTESAPVPVALREPEGAR
jgi:hypothetical protein